VPAVIYTGDEASVKRVGGRECYYESVMMLSICLAAARDGGVADASTENATAAATCIATFAAIHN